MRILETAIYVDDIERSAQFHERLFDFTRIVSDHRFRAFNMGTLPGGQRIPGYDGSGQTQLATRGIWPNY